jgi:NTE family protein
MLCVAFAIAAASSLAHARPRVCLVLSGGGARGAAHVGVLKVLEEMRVPVDCIAGTSMGSIVGGAYASGMPVADMERVLASLTTSDLFVERPPRSDLSMRRKRDDRGILFGAELGVGSEGLGLPKGLVTGIQLEAVLRRLVKTPGWRAFDALPIPYRAVATDLETGTAVVIGEGDVAHAMRASMSVPGAVAPAVRGDKLLVDGGLTDNLPVDVARAMGADIVIAVNLGTPLLKRDELDSALGVTSQMINILTEQNVRASLASLKPTDILIEPELGGFSAGDFDHLSTTVPIGEAAARKVSARLAALSLDADAYRELQAARVGSKAPAVVIDEIRLAPMARANPEVVRGWMQTQAGVPLDTDRLDRDLRRIYGTGDFERVGYSLLEEHGQHVLVVNAIEKSWGPNYLRLGLGLGSDFKGDNFFNAAASYRMTWLNPLGAEWRTDLQVGNTSRAVTEFYQPLFVSRALFIAPRAEAQRRAQDLFSGGQNVARFDVRQRLLGLDVGSEFTRFGEVRVGAVTGSTQTHQQIGPPSLEPSPDRTRIGAFTGRVEFDQLDNANFPRSGLAGRASLFASSPELGADQRYTRWDAEALGAYSWGRHTLQLAARGGAPMGSDRLPAHDQFIWGGFLQQSGYARGELTGQRLAFGRVVYTYQALTQHFLGTYLGMSLEAGHLGGPLVPGGVSGTLKSASAFIAFDTPVGPVYLGFGRAAGGSSAAYFYLGRP